MAVIRAQASPIFNEEIRALSQDDGGDPTLDRVDIVTEALLNNTKAAYNKAEEAAATPDDPSIIATTGPTYNIVAGDHTVLCDGSSNVVNAYLPTAVGRAGKIYVVKAIDVTNAVNLYTTGGETLDGAAVFAFVSLYNGITVQSDGANWWII